MNIKSVLSILAAVAAALTTSAQAGLLVTYNNGTTLGLFDETSGAKIRDFSTSLSNARAVTTDASGNVYVGNGGFISKFNIATGAFVLDIGNGTYGAVRALTFDPTKPDQIVTIRNNTAGTAGELAAERTDGTGSPNFRGGALGINYTGLAYYSNTVELYAPSSPANGGFVEAFSTDAGFTYNGVARSGLDITGGITTTATELYYVSTSGNYINTQIGNQNIITGLNDPRDITNNGTNLFVSNFGTDQVLAFTTGGAAVNGLSFSVTDPIAVAYTAVPEPSTVAFALLAIPALVAGRRLSRRLKTSV